MENSTDTDEILDLQNTDSVMSPEELVNFFAELDIIADQMLLEIDPELEDHINVNAIIAFFNTFHGESELVNRVTNDAKFKASFADFLPEPNDNIQSMVTELICYFNTPEGCQSFLNRFTNDAFFKELIFTLSCDVSDIASDDWGLDCFEPIDPSNYNAWADESSGCFFASKIKPVADAAPSRQINTCEPDVKEHQHKQPRLGLEKPKL